MRAARAFWFLDYLGHPNARILDGGFKRVDRRRPARDDRRHHAGAERRGTARPIPHVSRRWRDVLDRLGQPETAIVDTRSDAEYYAEAVRAKRGGAIPGAVHLEWTQNLTPDGRYKTAERSAGDVRAAGHHARSRSRHLLPGRLSGRTHLPGAEAGGFPNVRNYTGSWKEWGDREDLPLERTAGRG